MEYKKGYGPEMITGLAKVDGLLVGVVANQQGVFPNYPEYKMEKYGQSMGAGGKLYRQGLIKMNEFVTLCARDRIPMIWIQDTTGIDVGDDAEVAELLGLGQSLIYSIQTSKLPMMEITLRRGTAAAHYVLGGPQGNDNNAFSLGTAATEINVMNGKTAANAMYTGRLAKDQKAGQGSPAHHRQDERPDRRLRCEVQASVLRPGRPGGRDRGHAHDAQLHRGLH